MRLSKHCDTAVHQQMYWTSVKVSAGCNAMQPGCALGWHRWLEVRCFTCCWAPAVVAGQRCATVTAWEQTCKQASK